MITVLLIALPVFTQSASAAGSASSSVQEVVAPQAADKNDDDTDSAKVTICHRTNSNTNPYVVITVATDAAGGGKGDGAGDHAAEHQGPVWNPTLKAQHIEWGDIIPPYVDDQGVSYPGLNWDAGQAIYNNGCKNTEPPVGSPSGTIGDVNCVGFSGEVAVSASNADEATKDVSVQIKVDGEPYGDPETLEPGETLSGVVSGLSAGSHLIQLFADGVLLVEKTVTNACDDHVVMYLNPAVSIQTGCAVAQVTASNYPLNNDLQGLAPVWFVVKDGSKVLDKFVLPSDGQDDSFDTVRQYLFDKGTGPHVITVAADGLKPLSKTVKTACGKSDDDTPGDDDGPGDNPPVPVVNAGVSGTADLPGENMPVWLFMFLTLAGCGLTGSLVVASRRR